MYYTVDHVMLYTSVAAISPRNIGKICVATRMKVVVSKMLIGSVMVSCTGMLLRMFMNLYDLEIIDEEAFLKWKEDLNEEYPGKGKALFQVTPIVPTYY